MSEETLSLEEKIEHNGRLHSITLQKINDFQRGFSSHHSDANKRSFRKKVHDIRDICLTATALGAEHIIQKKELSGNIKRVFKDLQQYIERVDELLSVIDNTGEAIDQDIIPILTDEDISDLYQERYTRITDYIALLCNNPKEFYSRLLEEIDLEKLVYIAEEIEELIKQNSSHHYFDTIARVLLVEIDKSISFIRSTLSGEKNPYDHDVFYLIENNVMSAEEIILAHNYTVDIHVAPDCGKISVDKSDFDRVLFNLLTNAMKYGRSRDEIGTKNIEIYAFKTSKKCRDYLTLIVADEGIGIKPEDEDRIFDYEFMSEDNQISEGVERHGVGLNNVLDVLEGLGGEVFYINRKRLNPESKGSVFGVRMPYKKSTASIFDLM